MLNIRRHFDVASLTVVFITLVLFVAALFVGGFTHDLMLEAAVFLVSAKLILMTYRSSVSAKSMHAKLDDIYRALQDPQGSRGELETDKT